MHRDPVPVALDGDTRAPNDMQGAAFLGSFEMGRQQTRDVAAKIRPAREFTARGRSRRQFALGNKPGAEMIRLGGEGAHIRCTNIEEMSGIARRISESDAKIGAPLDKNNLDAAGPGP